MVVRKEMTKGFIDWRASVWRTGQKDKPPAKKLITRIFTKPSYKTANFNYLATIGGLSRQYVREN